MDSRNIIKIGDDSKDDLGAEVAEVHVTTSPLPVDMTARQEAVHSKTMESDEHTPDRPETGDDDTETGDDDTEKLTANERHSAPTTQTPPAAMMYPEVFTQQPDTSQTFKVNNKRIKYLYFTLLSKRISF